MNGHPLSVRIRFLTAVLEEVVVLVHDRAEALEPAVARLVAEVETVRPDPQRIVAAWDHTLAALAELDGGSAGGPLLALMFDLMLEPEHIRRGPVDLCLALALEQALDLLPDDPELAAATEVLVVESDKLRPDRQEIELAQLFASEALAQMVDDGTGGAMAVLLTEWLRSRGTTPGGPA